MALQFIYDRTVFLCMFLGYEGWRSTIGPSQWTSLVSKYSDFQLVILGTMVVSLTLYGLFSTILALVDLVLLPGGVLPGERLQAKKFPTLALYKKALPTVIFNFTFLALPTGYGVYYYFHPASPRNTSFASGLYPTLPPALILLRDVVLCVLVEEILFYYTHRLFHHPTLYALFHKKHHEFTAPIGVCAVYTTPLDFVVSNVVPLLVGPLLLKSHPVIIWFYFSEAIINTVVTHGGYTFFGFPNANMHDFHHETFNNMFGVIGLLDYLHGTDLKFRERNAIKKAKSACYN